MFCSNCGEELQATNQKFCHNCGAEVLTTSKTTNYKTERTQYVAAPKTQYAPAPKIQYVSVKPQRQLQRGAPGKYSKMCLILALVSIGVGIVSLVIGYNSFRYFYWPYSNVGLRIVVTIVVLLMRVGGLTMGVFSKVNSSKAEMFEPYNDFEKVGALFGIFGMIINGIGLFLSFVGPWGILNFPFGYM